MKSIIVCGSVLWCVLGAANLSAQDVGAPPVSGTYTTTWLGNSIVQGRTHVPQSIDGMFVTPDGRVLTNTGWDEGCAEVSEFDADGKVIAVAANTHGWGYNGGSCITANKQYVYFGQSVGNENGGLKDPRVWPPKGKDWYGVNRRLLSDVRQGAPFEGGTGHGGGALDHCFLVVGETPVPKHGEDTRESTDLREGRVSAIVASDQRLFVADSGQARICVYDAQTLAPIAEVPNWPRVSGLTLDSAGDLWIAQTAGANEPAVVSNLDKSLHPGAARIELAEGVQPVGLAIDSIGRVVVADGGRGARILTFDPRHLQGDPTTPVCAFGVSLFAGDGPDVGKIGPGKFSDLSAVGMDQAGNLYVASSRTGAVLEKYDAAKHRLWARYALVFVDNASIDPLTGDIYSSEEHFGFDWSKTEPGSEWSYLGKTLDRYRFPDDVRVNHEHSPLMRRLNGGRLYAFTCDQMASGIYVYRFDPQSTGEVAIPCACIVKGSLSSHRNLASGQFLWTDGKGDGRFDQSEISQPAGRPGNLGDDCWGWWVDEKGDIWQTVNGDGPDRGLRHFPLQGFNAHGAPIYSFNSMQVTPVPEPFLHRGNDGLERVIYDSNSDTMYLGGYTDRAQNDGLWGGFRVMARYDHWSTGNRKAAWVTQLPWHQFEKGREGEVPISMAQAGDYLFVVGVKTCARAGVYRARDGVCIGDMIPNGGNFTIDQTGWVDMRPFGVQASQRPDGSYAVLVEEDGYAKTIIYRWRP